MLCLDILTSLYLQIPNFIKRMVARDAELEKFRRKATAQAATGDEGGGDSMKSPTKKSAKSPSKRASLSPLTSASKKLKSPLPTAKTSAATASSTATAKTVQDKSKGNAAITLKRDFFGRVIENTNDRATKVSKKVSLVGKDITNEDEGEESEEEEEVVRVKYSFQKGFTNAIKRPVHMSDLM